MAACPAECVSFPGGVTFHSQSLSRASFFQGPHPRGTSQSQRRLKPLLPWSRHLYGGWGVQGSGRGRATRVPVALCVGPQELVTEPEGEAWAFGGRRDRPLGVILLLSCEDKAHRCFPHPHGPGRLHPTPLACCSVNRTHLSLSCKADLIHPCSIVLKQLTSDHLLTGPPPVRWPLLFMAAHSAPSIAGAQPMFAA